MVERLTSWNAPVIGVVAPPGYGKTTLLAQWAERRAPHVAWVSCERADNDPAALWHAVATAINAAAPVGPAPARVLAARGGGIDVVPAFVAAIGAVGTPMTIVLDHVEHITGKESHAALAEFCLRVLPGWQLAMASREPLPLPTARLRAEGRILELGPTDLAMSADEAAALLTGAGVPPDAETTKALVRTTEGWPVGLYLAALATRTGTPVVELASGGGDRWITEYLRSELLPRLSSDDVRFLERTSVLTRLCGSLCDAVAGTTDGARRLEDLVGRNMLVLPLDRRREWYRYHHLLRDHLQTELRLDAPDEVAELHSRAAAWYAVNDRPEDAVEHALAAGESDRVAELVLELMSPVWASGRVDTVLRWMEWLAHHPSARHHAAVMAHASLIHALLGRASEAEEWAEVAERQPPHGMLPDGSSVAGTLAYLRANLAREGMPRMRQDALDALEGLSPTSPFRATMMQVEGVSHLLERDLDLADAELAHATDLATAHDNLPLVSLILAERSVVAAERNEWTDAGSFARRALTMVDEGGFDGYWTSALVFATAARSAAHSGDIPAARRLVRRASMLRPLLTYALPVVSVQTLVELAHAYIGFAEHGGARAVLDQARAILQQRPDLGTMPETVELLRSRVGLVTGITRGASSLTAAELRLVPLLPTHLSMPEIGAQLHISRHTVKSQVISLYRKLGVSSRSEAVARITDLRLQASR